MFKLWWQTSLKNKNMKSENFEKIAKRLDWLWYNSPHPIHGGGHSVKANEEKICNIIVDVKKNTGNIRFDRWFDDNIFFATGSKNNFVLKPEYKDLKIFISETSGSATLKFMFETTETIKKIMLIIIDFGYECGYSDLEEDL